MKKFLLVLMTWAVGGNVQIIIVNGCNFNGYNINGPF